MIPPVGKSGPGSFFSSSSTPASGLSMKSLAAAATSFKLWGGMLVAIPTAIPAPPLQSRLGNFPGRTIGSVRVSS